MNTPKEMILEIHLSTAKRLRTSNLTVYAQKNIFGRLCIDYEMPQDCMFDYLRCCCEIIHHYRLGRNSKSNETTSGRPIKVQLKTAGEVKLVLLNVKYLKEDAYYSDVRLSKWLNKEELVKIKSLRLRCED